MKASEMKARLAEIRFEHDNGVHDFNEDSEHVQREDCESCLLLDTIDTMVGRSWNPVTGGPRAYVADFADPGEDIHQQNWQASVNAAIGAVVNRGDIVDHIEIARARAKDLVGTDLDHTLQMYTMIGSLPVKIVDDLKTDWRLVLGPVKAEPPEAEIRVILDGKLIYLGPAKHAISATFDKVKAAGG